MNKALLALLCLPFLIASCKEKGPFIDFGPVAKDTAYMEGVQTPQTRGVLIEEFTGIKCSNCPDGHAVVASLESQHPNQVIAVGLHMFNNPLANPRPEISPVDFRTNEATDIDHDVYSTQTSLPFAGIDRVPYNSNLVIDRGNWSVATNNRLATAPPVNVSITSTYDATSNKAVVKVTAHYTSAVSKKQLLSVMLTEDDIDAPQDYVDGSTGLSATHDHYTHNHILHKMYTAAAGDAILNTYATKDAGLVYERVLIIDLTGQTWNPDNCKVVAFISNNEAGDKEVLQAAEVPLK